MIRSHERRVYCGIKFLEFIEDSKIFQDPDSPSSFGSAHVSHQALVTSSLRKSSRESRMQRNTREDMSIPQNVFDCQPARRVPEESHSGSRNLATPSGIQKREGIEKSGSEEPLQPIPFPCFSVRAREKSLDDRNCLMSMTNHAVGIGICSTQWHDNSEFSFLGDASGKTL